MTPQPLVTPKGLLRAKAGVTAEEAGAAVAAEFSIGTWTTVWTDGLISLVRYKGRCYNIESLGEDDQ